MFEFKLHIMLSSFFPLVEANSGAISKGHISEPEAEANELELDKSSVPLRSEVNKLDLTVDVFDKESSVLDEILSVESEVSTSRLDGATDGGDQQPTEVIFFLKKNF